MLLRYLTINSPPLHFRAECVPHQRRTRIGQDHRWHYRHGEKDEPKRITPRLTCNQLRTASLACGHGLGITRLMHYQVADELADGRLVRNLEDYESPDPPIQLV